MISLIVISLILRLDVYISHGLYYVIVVNRFYCMAWYININLIM